MAHRLLFPKMVHLSKYCTVGCREISVRQPVYSIERQECYSQILDGALNPGIRLQKEIVYNLAQQDAATLRAKGIPYGMGTAESIYSIK